jgi:hypothetical protein
MPVPAHKKLKIINIIFGRIKEVSIFALPNKKGVKKSVLRVVKKSETNEV